MVVTDPVKSGDDDERPKKKTGSTIGAPIPADEPSSESAGIEATSSIFAHDPRTLFRLNGTTFTKVGPFKCLLPDEEVIDIAVNSKGASYATSWGQAGTYSRLLRFEPDGACSEVVKADGIAFPNSLSFVPKGTVDSNVDALVGYVNRLDQETGTYTGTDYVRLNLTTGKVSKIGVLQRDLVSTRYACSGDIVAVDGGKTYLTVRHSDEADATVADEDSLVEVDPKTGEIARVVGSTGFRELWGLAYWQNKAYGFSGSGEVVSLNLTSGQGTLLEVESRPKTFYGAAVTPGAPQ